MEKGLKNPAELWEYLKQRCKPVWKTAFFAAVILGLLIHMPILVRDIPNHDGLDSMYFDQNMITSGRWFLSVACGVSSYFNLPWVIGVLGLFYLGITSVLLTEFLEIQKGGTAVLVGGLLAAFPALASTFAYVFTLDGYMLALLLAVSAPLFVKKYKRGFIAGGVALAFSMGIYQSYLSFAMLLSLYGVLLLLLSGDAWREKLKGICNYLFMGMIGAGLYYLLLQLLLKIQGKELASYQGISDMGAADVSFLSAFKDIYTDFISFSARSGILFKNLFSIAAFGLLCGLALVLLIGVIIKEKKYTDIRLYVMILLLALAIPVAANVILLVSPAVNYHLLMRYQWVLFPILTIAFADKYGRNGLSRFVLLIAGGVLIFHYALTDNIAYSNLEKKYERTYAYCLRLADRMEQTEGYYQGIPIAMIGVVSDTQYPLTDITGEVTGSITGMTGDYLLYTRTNYQAFFKHYLGITINLVSDEEMLEIYDSPEYRAMGTFPQQDSLKVVDGILYIKLENKEE